MSKISELSDGGSLVSTDYLIAVRSGGNVKVRMDEINVDQVDLGDNEFIRLGNSQDLTLVHDASNSIINQAGIGDLLIQKAGSTKLTVNSTGVDITGILVSDGLTVDGDALFTTNTATNPFVVSRIGNTTESLQITFDDANAILTSEQDEAGRYGGYVFNSKNDGTTVKRMEIAHTTGDISFYDTSANQAFFWDASAASLGIGTTSPDTALELSRLNDGVNGNVPTLRFTDTDASSAAGQKSGQIEFKTSDTTPGPAGVHSFINGQTEGTSGLGALVFGTGQSGSATEAMRIDASGSVGIGTDSPNAPLTVQAATSSSAINLIGRLSDGYSSLAFRNNANDTSLAAIYADDSSDSMQIFVAGTEAMRIDASGNVGIGNSSAVGKLEVYANNTAPAAYIRQDGTGPIQSWHIAAGAEKMRLEASGNLLVGTTSTSIPNQSSNTGIFLFGGGSINVARSGDECAIFNRLTSDGEIVRIQKDGTTVGSIRTISGDSIGIGTGFAGLRFINGTNRIQPVDMSTGLNSDALTSLGDTNKRFKDLYLSGGIDISQGAAPQTAFVDFTKTINDDAVFSFTPDKTIGVLYIYGRNNSYKSIVGMVSWRSVSTAFCQQLLDPYNTIETSTSVLTGTTGTSGQVTISAVSSDGKIYIENRSGVAISIGIHVTGQ